MTVVALRVLERGLCPLPSLATIADSGLADRFVDQRRGREAQMHCVASSRGAVDAVPAQRADAPRVEATSVGHGPG